MGASNTIKLLARAGIEAERTAEPVRVPPETILRATDPEDELYCPGVEDEPSESLVASMRQGWVDGSTISCVNRGPKGGEPIPYIVAGRSRQKAALIVNKERAEQGLPPLKVEIVFVDPSEAYRIMLLENNKQKRRPLFDARRWEHHKRVAAKRLGKTTLSEQEKAEARTEFAELVGKSESIIARWEAILSAHPTVISAIESGTISQNEAYRIVQQFSHEEQPGALPVEKTEEPAPPATNESPSGKPAEVKPARQRQAIRMRPARQVASLFEHVKKMREDAERSGEHTEAPMMVDAYALLAWLTGDDAALDGEELEEVKRLAQRAGWKVKK